MTKWLAWCPHCRKYATEAAAPKSADFVDEVQCSLCNKPINANIGQSVNLPIHIEVKKVDLLEVL
jgi:hypothetical protein